MAQQNLTVTLTAAQVQDALDLGYPPAAIKQELEEVAHQAIAKRIWEAKAEQSKETARAELRNGLVSHNVLWDERV